MGEVKLNLSIRLDFISRAKKMVEVLQMFQPAFFCIHISTIMINIYVCKALFINAVDSIEIQLHFVRSFGDFD